MESIIGETIDELTKELLTHDLTEEAVILKIKSAELALSMARQTERQLEASNASLVAHRDYLAEHVGLSQRLGRFVQPEEIKQYLTIFFSRAPNGCSLDWDTPAPRCGRITLSGSSYRELLAFMDRSGITMYKGIDRDMIFALTPEALTEHQKKWRRLFLMNHFHPLVRWVTSAMQIATDGLHPLSALEYCTPLVAPGHYVFLIRKVEFKGLYPRERLLYGLLDMSRRTCIHGEKAEEMLNLALRDGVSVAVGHEVPVREEHMEALRSHIDECCGRMREDYLAEMQIKASARRVQVSAHFDRKIEATERSIETMRDAPTVRQRGIELMGRQLSALKRKRDERLTEISSADRTELAFSEVTCGYLRVQGPRS